ncbi:hypothetical protein MGYG_08479 [Nannizzia gypsea CBS 118893]|uniref:Uncharacterized protein n=1 Tax=Arthroderma gypseum (strain ATCC MYA-4604 / CBS 118893) TaxID=535722 RepID=E4V5U1_ARTGP|nr:hypothetical protein MGYG_08479 [Nannizzia gypsea CBS 118893]EFR05466.1 hypothetical protein MGYG_08479 [Nannizzia gypsea CBS 118893]
MQIALAYIFLLAGIAHAARVSVFSFITIISHRYGLTAEFDSARKLVKFIESDDRNQFFMDRVGPMADGLHIVQSDDRYNQTTNHIRFPQARDGEVAILNSEWASTFLVEVHEDAVFSFILLDPSKPGSTLAWTVERHSVNDPMLVLKLRTYDSKARSQQFSIISRCEED